MRNFLLLLTLIQLSLLAYGCGEDRSGEQPFAPTLGESSCVVDGDSAFLTGTVTTSPNSSLRECGFQYGNDTLSARCVAPEPLPEFTAVTDSLGAGDYYAVPYARNGMGTSYGDTLYFVIE